MIIHGPTNAEYDVDLGPVVVSDWYHTDYFTIVENLFNKTVSLGAATRELRKITQVRARMHTQLQITTLLMERWISTVVKRRVIRPVISRGLFPDTQS